jgi:hypothetical protein
MMLLIDFIGFLLKPVVLDALDSLARKGLQMIITASKKVYNYAIKAETMTVAKYERKTNTECNTGWVDNKNWELTHEMEPYLVSHITYYSTGPCITYQTHYRARTYSRYVSNPTYYSYNTTKDVVVVELIDTNNVSANIEFENKNNDNKKNEIIELYYSDKLLTNLIGEKNVTVYRWMGVISSIDVKGDNYIRPEILMMYIMGGTIIIGGVVCTGLYLIG